MDLWQTRCMPLFPLLLRNRRVGVFRPDEPPLEEILATIGWEPKPGNEHYFTLGREGTEDTEQQKPPYRGRLVSLFEKLVVAVKPSSGRKNYTTPQAYSLSRPSVVVDAVNAALLDFYSEQNPDMRAALKKKFDGGKIFYVVTEAIDNSREHVPESDTFSIGLWLGRNGICLGFYDGGTFFARPEIKATFEGDSYDALETNVKIIIDKKTAKKDDAKALTSGEERESMHKGLLLMHKYSDQRCIEVRRRDGTALVVLYCMLAYNRLFPTAVPARR